MRCWRLAEWDFLVYLGVFELFVFLVKVDDGRGQKEVNEMIDIRYDQKFCYIFHRHLLLSHQSPIPSTPLPQLPTSLLPSTSSFTTFLSTFPPNQTPHLPPPSHSPSSPLLNNSINSSFVRKTTLSSASTPSNRLVVSSTARFKISFAFIYTLIRRRRFSFSFLARAI